ncbi:fimbrillin family protein [Bacteroides caecigallinarum]|uniref:fimbrillin family protein n=1 Tax=Bacteroides caecigallinarum TaxID=1411144 RepID=UPI001F21A6CF|nr:fimbrillin family protein [Bacteroides caecigallinarum]MCF2580999.1 fimbrillin family protein [Bacteroides caecigallinarum]
MLTRAFGQSWEANDAIGVSVYTPTDGTPTLTQYTNMHYVTTAGDGNFTHSGGSSSGIFFQDADETVYFRAYYPFDEDSQENNGEVTITDVRTDNQSDQKNFDFMFATGATASKNSPTVKFNNTDNGTTDARFKHMMTRLVLNITTDTDAGFSANDVEGGAYSLSGIKHSGTFNTEDGTAEATGNATDNWEITDYITYTNNIGTCSLILYPQTGASLTFSATIDGQTYTGTLTPAFAASTSYSYDISIQKTGLVISSGTIQDWTNGGGDNIIIN